MNKQESHGNFAKMREALKLASYFLHQHHMGAVYAPDGETMIFCDDVAKAVDAALAAPASNCDRFDDYTSAKDYFLENELWKYNRDLTPEYWFGVWLFELAEKGGSEATTVDAV